MKKVTIHLPRWEELPNIDLYLDQVVTLMEEYLGSVSKEEKIITKTMINNYVKHGILKSPENKKYNKEHLAKIIVICILKQIYSINDIGKLIELALDTAQINISYNRFATELEKAINLIFNKIETEDDYEMTEERYILKNVTKSLACKLYVEKNFLNKQ